MEQVDIRSRAQALYVRNLDVKSFTPPYYLSESLRHGIEFDIVAQPLDNEGYWSVLARVAVQAAGSETEALHFYASVEVEQIYALGPLPAELRPDVIRKSLASYVFGHARAALATATASTGYGPVHLPPVSTDVLANRVQVLTEQKALDE